MKLREIQRKARRDNLDAVITAEAYGHKVTFQ